MDRFKGSVARGGVVSEIAKYVHAAMIKIKLRELLFK
jgi:hypothetical protein